MTKKVRIENADVSPKQLLVQVFEKGAEGQPDTLVSEYRLLNPADLAELVIHGTRYLVVKEA